MLFMHFAYKSNLSNFDFKNYFLTFILIQSNCLPLTNFSKSTLKLWSCLSYFIQTFMKNQTGK